MVLGGLSLIVYQSTPNSVLARQTIVGRMPGVLSTVRRVDRMFNIFYRGEKLSEPLTHYDIRIDPEDYRMLEEKLPTQTPSPWYGNLFLTDESKHWVKADFTVDGESYKVKMRVRGDIFNHWSYRKKSWRIKFPKDNLYRGMREMNLIIPEDRGWMAEHLAAYRAEKFNLLHPPIRFVTTSINGSSPMLYTEVEHWSKEMLEKKGRPGDVNLYQTGGGESYFQQWDPVFQQIAYWGKYRSNPSTLDSYEEIEALMHLTRDGASQDPAYQDQLAALLDVERLISWYALTILSGSRHVEEFNIRLFFDPSRGVFEIIPWDIFAYPPRTLLSIPENPILREVFRVPELRLRVYEFLWAYVNDEQQVAEDTRKLQELRRQVESAVYRDDVKLQSNRQVAGEIDRFENILLSNMSFLKKELKRCEVLEVQRIPDDQTSSQGTVLILDLTARGIAPGRLMHIKLPQSMANDLKSDRVSLWRDGGSGVYDDEDGEISFTVEMDADEEGRIALKFHESPETLLWVGEPDKVDNKYVAPHTRHRFFLVHEGGSPLPGDSLPLGVQVRNAVTGKKVETLGNQLIDGTTLQDTDQGNRTQREFLRDHRAFTPGLDGGVVLRGTHIFRSSIIVPRHVPLRIEPGTILRMGPGVNVIAYAPVVIDGSPTSPVTISALNSSTPWGVFGVINAGGQSLVQWADVSGGSEATVNGTYMSGQMAFHASPVTIRDSYFHEARGDDGLNIKHVPADIQRSRFAQNSADGLDVDMAPSGVIEQSSFANNGNDGLDISWSPIIIRSVVSEYNGDKCISVGERSAPLIQDTSLKGCPMGIAVKDDSHAKVERTVFTDNGTAIAAYIKKPFFEAPSVTVLESTFEGNGERVMTLSGAVVSIDSAG